MSNKTQLTILLPTFNEKKNVGPIIEEIRGAMKGKNINYDILFIDDSSDDTPAEIEKQIKENVDIEIGMIHRSKEERTGLATAFIKGFDEARGEYICCMDSDLQHPPQIIPKLFEKALEEKADIVTATRYCKGGSAEGLGKLTSFYGIYRRAVSLGLKYFTQIIFIPARSTSDPLGGFFLFKKTILQGAKFYPKGFKILVEVLTRTKYQKVSEVPYKFSSRENEESKATLRQGLEFFKHIWNIFLTVPEAGRFLKFCLVGASGVFVNLGVLFFLVDFVNLDKANAWFVALVVSIFSNYSLNAIFTYGDKRSPTRNESLKRMGIYYLISFLTAGFNFIIYISMMDLGAHYIVGAFVGILLTTILNFVLATKLVWKIPLGIKK